MIAGPESADVEKEPERSTWARPPRAALLGLGVGLVAWALLRPWGAHLPLPWMLALGVLGGLVAARRQRPAGGDADGGTGLAPGGARGGGAWEAGDSLDPGDEAPPVELELGDTLDLHVFRPQDVSGLVRAFLDEAAQAGLGTVRVVHGKGRGVQRRLVHAVLADHPAVAGWDQADGNWGATVVRLRPVEREG